MYPSFILSPFLIGTQNPHFMARFWLMHCYYYFFNSDTQKFRAHRATVEIYRTRGAITKIQFLKVLKFKIPFMIILRLVFVGKSRHVITLSRRGWLHSAGSQRKISQRAQVRGKQKEERGAPQITLLPSNAALVIRLEVRSRKSDEACF